MANEKEETPVVVDGDADGYLMVAAEGTELSGLELEAAGVDMRVTKADVLELVTAQMKEQLESDFKALKLEWVEAEYNVQLAVQNYVRKTYPELMKVYSDLSGKGPGAWIGKPTNQYGEQTGEEVMVYVDNTVTLDLPRALKSMETWLRTHSVETPHGRHGEKPGNVIYQKKTKKKEFLLQLRATIELDVEDLPPAILEAQKKRDDIIQQTEECVRDYHDMHKVERKARYKLANKILSATKEGKKLLRNLEGFKTRKVRALKA